MKSYADLYAKELKEAASFLRAAREKLPEGKLSEFLLERALSLESDQYEFSDGLWLDLWDEPLDILIGPIESYEDAYRGIKSAYQSCIVVKDQAATEDILPLLEELPDLKLDLKREIRYERGRLPRAESVGVYHALAFSGLFNAGSKSMGLNAPHFIFPAELEDRGKRRLILKNIVEAKFEYIAVPIAEALLLESQRASLSAEAFFQYVLFHEISHGWELAPFERIQDDKSIQEYLLQYASIMEEGKGDILGLYMINQAYKQALIQDDGLESHYVTSLVNALRAIRFGRNSAHAIANMIRLNFFLEKKAYAFDEETGTFRVIPENMDVAIKGLVEKILDIQSSGNANLAMQLIQQYGYLKLAHERILEKYEHIPLDLRFE